MLKDYVPSCPSDHSEYKKSQRGSTLPITRQLQESPRGKLLDTGDVERPHIHKVARDGCGGSHNGADQMGAAVFALTPLEVTVRSAGAALMRRQNIGVHPDAHAATRIAPLEACLAENLVESFFFGLRFDPARTRHNQRLLDAARHMLARHQMRRSTQIFEARICARPNEYAVH